MPKKKVTVTATLFLILLCIGVLTVMVGCQSQEPSPTLTPTQTQEQEATATQTEQTTGAQWEDAHANSIPIISAPASLMQDYKAPPQNVQDFVNRSKAIVIGTVTAISEPVVERPYNFDPAVFAGIPESDWPSIEVAYWNINIEEVLLNDDNIEANPKLRMEPNPLHRPDKPHPELNGRYLFTLGRNPDSLSYGITADWMILDLTEAAIKDIDGKTPAFIDGAQEAALVNRIREAAGNHDYLPPGQWPSRFDSDPADAGEP